MRRTPEQTAWFPSQAALLRHRWYNPATGQVTTIPDWVCRMMSCPTSLTNSIEGSGLGLAIVQSVVQAHGGRVSVETLPGEGSRFLIELPLDEMPLVDEESGLAQGNH